MAAAAEASATNEDGQKNSRDLEQPLLRSPTSVQKAGSAPGTAAGDMKAAKASPGKIVKLVDKTGEADGLQVTVRALCLGQRQVFPSQEGSGWGVALVPGYGGEG